MGLTTVLGGILLFALFHNPVQAAQSVTLAWDPSPDPTVVGYKIYFGVASRTYTNVVDVGNATSVSIPGLVEGTTCFLAATAYDMLGLESVFSNEISHTVPVGLPTVAIRVAANGQVVLTVTGQIGHSYDVLETRAFTAWTVIGTVTLEDNGSLDFVDANAAYFPARFYRAQENP